ncbi:MAG: HEAT repeat domain-containing protein [Firmicutes bacterium]|nr:HEAT repeat domain-containing protein [Bacillota bacterium]
MWESLQNWLSGQAANGLFWAALCGGIILLCALLFLLRRALRRRAGQKRGQENKNPFRNDGDIYPGWRHTASPSGEKNVAFVPVEQEAAGEDEGDFLTLAEKISASGGVLPETLVQRIKKRNPYSLADVVAAWPDCSPLLQKQLSDLVSEQQMMPSYLQKILKDGVSQQVFVQAWPHFGNESLMESMVDLLGDRDEKMQMAGVKLLSAIQDPRMASALAMALLQPARYVPARVADAFTSLGKDGARLLVYLLPEVEGENKIRVLQVLGQMGAVWPLDNVSACLQDADPAIRVAAVEALAAHPSLTDASVLAAAVADENAKVRAAAAKALGKTGDAHAGEWLSALSRDEDWVVAANAKEALDAWQRRQNRLTT